MATSKRVAIFTFAKPSVESTVATTRIARYMAETLQLPLWHDAGIGDQKLDVLFIINGAFAFCDCLPAIGAAVQKTRRIVWVQNDYTIKPPQPDSAAESPFRKAFRVRKGEPLHYWTTVKDNAAKTELSRYVNWNSLTYNPLPPKRIEELRREYNGKDLFYYGAYRMNRVGAFERFFKKSPVPVTISSTSDKFRVFERPGVVVEKGIQRSSFSEELASHGLGLYIEDRMSHLHFHSPANRLYEMLAAGLPIVFEHDATLMLEKAGFRVADSTIIRNDDDLLWCMKNRNDIGKEQRKAWHGDYVGMLTLRLKRFYREVTA